MNDGFAPHKWRRYVAVASLDVDRCNFRIDVNLVIQNLNGDDFV